MALGRSVDSYVEEGFSPVVNKEERSKRRLTMVAGVGAAVLGAVALSAVTFSDSGMSKTYLEQARVMSLQANGTEDAAGAGAAPVISFPDDYPNSVRHFLLIGFLGNLISAGVFFFLSMAKEHKSVISSFTWMCCTISALAYYAMWAGVGVQYKTTDVTPRVIFWARYVDRFLTTPLLLCALSAFAKAEFPVLISLLGADLIMMACLSMGAFVFGPDKYFWWVGALILFIIMVSQLLTMLAKVEDEKRKEVMRTLTWLTIISYIAYIVLWLLGSEGTAALGLSQEVGLTTIVDLVSKVGVLFFLISNMDESDESKATGLTLA